MSQKAQRVEHSVDSELIERCIGGDESAWADLIYRYQRLVYSVARSLCGNQEDASDVFQQVCLELYQRLGDLRNIDTLPAWLITVTRRRAYAVVNSRKPTTELDTNQHDASATVQSVEEEHALEQALDQLPERCRRLIDLLYFNVDEPSYASVADKLGMPVASVGPTRARCLEKLRKLLG
jgi:RNA polymerase sigma factor (sigma-70 family)